MNAGVISAFAVALFLLGVPLFAVLAAATSLSLNFLADLPDITAAAEYELARNMFRVLDQDALLAIPLYVLGGVIMSGGGMGRRLVSLAKAMLGWAPAGLAIAAVLACVVFGAVSGSSPATVVAIGMVMYPAMLKAGYDDRFTQGLLSSGGSLGILIPPSIPMVVYAIMVPAASVSALFMAGVVPGLLIAAVFAAYSVFVGVREHVPRTSLDLKALGAATREAIWSILLPVIVLGGIYSGLLTVNESAAVAVVYALIVERYIHKELRWREIPRLVSQSAVEMGVILIIVMIAAGFSQYLTFAGVPDTLTGWLKRTIDSPIAFLISLNVVLLIAGCLMDSISAILILSPILASAGAAYNIDPVHLGIITIVNLEIGYLTPPFGINLFVASALFEQPLGRVLRGVLPFIVLMLICLVLITFVPDISLVLGRMLQ